MYGSLPNSVEEGSPLLFRTRGRPLILIYLGKKQKESLRIGRKRVPRLNA
jgi:hypothetical protein